MTRSPRGDFARLLRASIVLAGVALLGHPSAPVRAVSPDVVISQVYGGGGNSGATLKNDFIELFNRGNTTVSLAGWSVQYASSAGTTWQVTPLTESLAPGQHYLVQEAAGTGGVPGPTPDATGGIAMSATTGKVALVNSTTPLSGTGCPFGGTVVDFVGYGTANCFEGAATPALTNPTAAHRLNNGCTDTDTNSADFTVLAPSPRNTASAATPCTGPTNPSGIGAATPNSVDPGGSTLLTVTVTPGENPTSTGIVVSADLTAIGGAPFQPFFDDATHGDLAGGDNVFSFETTVGASTGLKTLPVAIADSFPRSATTSIALTVRAPVTVVISQIYGGGGNSGAIFHNDYVELYNASSVSVDLAGWTLQYASATGSGWSSTSQPLGGMIGPGEYFLIALASGGDPGAPLPPANVTGAFNAINMSASTGKVALVRNGAALVGTCPLDDPDLVDFLGYGSSANCNEGGANAPGVSNTTALFRAGGGAIDSNNNLADFATGAPNPRRTAPIAEIGPAVFNTDPGLGGANAPRDASITVNFTEPVDVSGAWFDVTCATSGSHNDATFGGGSSSHVITPNVNFLAGESCTVTIFKDQVHDQDTDDGAPSTDTLAANHVWSFTVATGTAPAYPPDVHLAMGNPSGAVTDLGTPNNYLMEKPEFTLSYNRDRGTPNWVSWHLADEWVGTLNRVDTFRPDPAVPSDWYRVQATDFFGSGFDRGHMVPNADRDKETSIPINQATFLMSNMIPQAPDNNQGPWANLENYLRTLLPANELYVVSGPAGTGGTGAGGFAATIADGHVTVPASTWKVALVLPKEEGDDVARVTAAARTIAVVMPNIQGIRTTDPNDWLSYLVSVDAVEDITGYDFFSPVSEAVQNSIEAGVNGTNPPGVADQLVPGQEDTPQTLTLEAVSPNASPLTYTIVTPPAHGAVTGSDADRIYAPDADFNGTDSFTFQVSDGTFTSNVGTVTLQVQPVNDAPALAPIGDRLVQLGETLTFTALGSDVDVPAQPLTYSLSSAPAGASIDAATGVFTWTPTAAQSGATYSFLVQVSDGVASASTGVTATVTDTTPPLIDSVDASPNVIWPPNGRLVPVKVHVHATDLGGTPTCRVTRVTNNESGSRDAVIVGSRWVLVRAERNGHGHGRVYTIVVTCTDPSGNASQGSDTVLVPHHRPRHRGGDGDHHHHHGDDCDHDRDPDHGRGR